jgi:mRNA interferase HigB
MRIISKTRLKAFWSRHHDAARELTKWYAVTDKAKWSNPADVKQSFGVRVDFVRVESGNTVAVFDILNNRYRLIAAIHYNYPRVFVLRILTHAEYDTNKWTAEYEQQDEIGSKHASQDVSGLERMAHAAADQ